MGKKLTAAEKNLLRKIKPWGIIIFSRNIKNLSQLKKLIKEIKDIFKDKKYPILIDQEGYHLLIKLDLSDFEKYIFHIQFYTAKRIL